jgi:hypothetical protein
VQQHELNEFLDKWIEEDRAENKTMPMMAVGNDELGECVKEGDIVSCPHCGKTHPLRCSRDEKGRKSDLLLFIRCGKASYVVGMAGKLLKNHRKA